MSETNQQKTTHLDWVDGARVFAILSVILLHVPAPCVWNAPLLTSSLALFFILSGYFSSARFETGGANQWSYTRKRILAFAKPYIFWNLLFTAGDIAMKLNDPSWQRGDWHDPVRLLLECFGLGYAPALIPLWFLRDLIIFIVVASVLLPRFKICFALLTMACFLLSAAPDAEAWPKPYMFGNFGLGVMLGWISSSAEKWGNLPLSFHTGVLSLFLFFCVLPHFGGNVIYEPITPLGVLALLSAGVIWASSRTGKWLPLLGKSIFFIYCFHTMLIVILMGVERETGVWSAWIWWSSVPIIGIASLFIYRFLLRRFPYWIGWISC